jgi:FMN phosphatase YigB (HAD superfamily)
MSIGVDEKSLGLRLQAARKAAGLTQQELCQKAHLAYSTLAKIERGAIKAPSIFTIQSIADTVGLSLDELIGSGTTPKPKPAKKTSKSGISFIYFDINGCLVRFFHQAFSRLAHETGVPVDQIETTFWHYNDEVCRGDMSLADFNVAFAKRLNIPSIDWQRYYLDAVEPISEMQTLLPWAAEHYKIGLLSNIMPGLIEALQAAGKIPTLPYDSVVDSSVAKAIKPEAAIYKIAQEQAKVPVDQILFVDDSRTNLMAAEKLGWHVMWFDDYRPAESVEHIRQALSFE